MKHFLSSTLVCLLLILYCFDTAGQGRKKPTAHRNTSSPVANAPAEISFGYLDLAVAGDSIWTVTTNGKLKLLSSSGDELPLILINNYAFKSVAYLGHDTLIITTGSAINLLNAKTLVWKRLAALPAKSFFLTRDQQRQLYVATDKGILNLTSGRIFLPDSSLNFYYKWRPEPAANLLDSNGILWVGFGMGEWGGNLHVFNTRTQKFGLVTFKDSLACLNPVKAFCQIKNQVYMASSVMHFITSGCITRFEGFTARHVFNSSYKSNYRTITYGNPSGEYVGALAYNENKNCIYYYSQSGVFEGNLNTDLSKTEAWRLLFAPQLHWRDGQRDAIGSPMNVRKMVFAPGGRLILLTQNDGIGIWDGRIFHLIP